MKAIVQNEDGSPEALQLQEIDKPEVKETQIRVRVRAAALNAGDYFSVRGSPCHFACDTAPVIWTLRN